MNVILTSPLFSLNGPNVFVANLVRGLQAGGVSAHVLLTRPDWRDEKPLTPPADVPIRTLPVDPFASWRTRWRAIQRYLEERAPCVYVPNYDFCHSCVSPRLSERVSIVGIVHSDDAQHYEHVARLGRFWNVIVAVSQAVADRTAALDSGFAARMVTIAYGVDVPRRLPERRCDAGETLKVIYAGRLIQQQKRVLDLPRIVRALCDHDVPVQLTVVGDGPERAKLSDACARLGVRERVRLLGMLPNNQVLDALASHDVFLLPSEYEGLPLSLLEAMGRGCVPVVADVRSGVPELVREGVSGFRVPVGDVQAFAGRLTALHRDIALRQTMAAESHHTVRVGGYRREDMVHSYLSLFHRVLAETEKGAFRRPQSKILPPPSLPWQDHLPAPLHRIGHYGMGLLTGTE